MLKYEQFVRIKMIALKQILRHRDSLPTIQAILDGMLDDLKRESIRLVGDQATNDLISAYSLISCPASCVKKIHPNIDYHILSGAGNGMILFAQQQKTAKKMVAKKRKSSRLINPE